MANPLNTHSRGASAGRLSDGAGPMPLVHARNAGRRDSEFASLTGRIVRLLWNARAASPPPRRQGRRSHRSEGAMPNLTTRERSMVDVLGGQAEPASGRAALREVAQA